MYSSTSWFIINLFTHFFFVVVSADGRKSTTKYIYIGFPQPTLPSCNWIAPMHDSPWNTRECGVSLHISCNSTVFQFHHLPHDIALSLYDEMKLRFSNSLWTYSNLNALRISATIREFGWDHRKGNIFLQLQWKDLTLMYETETFLSSLSWISILSLLYPSSQQSRTSEECSKKCEPYEHYKKTTFLLVSAVLRHQRQLKYVKCYEK
jgi:hypothetical protein